MPGKAFSRESVGFEIHFLPVVSEREGRSMRRTLVTGAAGFIGSRVVEKLLEAGVEVVGIDSFDETLNSADFRKAFISHLTHPNFTFIKENLLTVEIETLVTDLDSVIHLAATPGLVPSWQSFEKYLENNILGTFRLAKALAQPNIQCKIIHASTSSIYGGNAVGDESLVPMPVSPYGLTKLASEHIWNSFFQEDNQRVTILRYFSVYGPRQREDMAWQKFIRLLVNDQPISLTNSGSHTRSFTFIDDVADITVKLANGQSSGGVYNIAGDEEINVLEGINLIAKILNREPRFNFLDSRPGDQVRTKGNNSRAKLELGFNPKFKFSEGIQRQITDVMGQ